MNAVEAGQESHGQYMSNCVPSKYVILTDSHLCLLLGQKANKPDLQGGTIGHERGGGESTEASVGGVVGEIGEDPAGDYAECVNGGEIAGFSWSKWGSSNDLLVFLLGLCSDLCSYLTR